MIHSEWTCALLMGIGAYLVGSIPTAYTLVRLSKNIDIREVGTGNVGALNTFHQTGLWGGSLVLVVDASKGALAVLMPIWIGPTDWTVFFTTPSVVAGHNWPIFLAFRGGKGAASILGISLAIVPILTVITVAPTVLIMVLLRNVVLGAAFGFILLNSLLVATEQDAARVGLCASLTLLVTGTYMISIRKHIINSIKHRQWRQLFTGLA